MITVVAACPVRLRKTALTAGRGIIQRVLGKTQLHRHGDEPL